MYADIYNILHVKRYVMTSEIFRLLISFMRMLTTGLVNFYYYFYFLKNFSKSRARNRRAPLGRSRQELTLH